jgi:hypothetical protein
MISARSKDQPAASNVANTIPTQLIVGIVLIAISWPVAWFGPIRLAEHSFFPLWLGYILSVDGLVERRTGSSLLRRSGWRFAALFFVSIPFWWIFEAVNNRIGNWEYLYPRDIGTAGHTIGASIAFSTVVPALFETAELYWSTGVPQRFGRWKRFAPSEWGLIGFIIVGSVMFLLPLFYPRQTFPLVWIGLFFVLDPLVNLLGGRSLSAQVARGRWDTVVALFLAGITCGFFWEMWNSLSMPKWVYHIPVVDRPKLFEMPLLGYGGYFPFALEVYATVQALNLLFRCFPSGYLRFDEISTGDEKDTGRVVRS